MVLAVHLIESYRGVHRVEAACIAGDILNSNLIVAGEAASKAKMLRMNMPESLKSNDVLKAFNQSEISDRPLLETIFVTRRHMSHYPNRQVFLLCTDEFCF